MVKCDLMDKPYIIYVYVLKEKRNPYQLFNAYNVDILKKCPETDNQSKANRKWISGHTDEK
jgi:hypothetical protein